ncbi:MAG TPA: hypothetical protein VEA99_10905 [Gemmatimonadaceae bacterium]|nr:hypothetical protein [Gemmatimonadaceae bacterium]
MTRPPLPGSLRLARGLAIALLPPVLLMLLAMPVRDVSTEEWIAIAAVSGTLAGLLAVAVGITRRARAGRVAGVLLGVAGAIVFVVRVRDSVAMWAAGGVPRAAAILGTSVQLGLVLLGALCLRARRADVS